MITRRDHAREIVDVILSMTGAAVSEAAKDRAITWVKLKLDTLCEQAREKEADMLAVLRNVCEAHRTGRNAAEAWGQVEAAIREATGVA